MTYRCRTCGRTYRQSDPPISCTVLHAPGTCCHYGETQVPERIARAPWPPPPLADRVCWQEMYRGFPLICDTRLPKGRCFVLMPHDLFPVGRMNPCWLANIHTLMEWTP